MEIPLGKVKTDMDKEPFPKRKRLLEFSVFVVVDFLGRAFGSGNDGICLFALMLGLALDLGHRRNGVALSDFCPVRPGHALLCHDIHLGDRVPEKREKHTREEG